MENAKSRLRSTLADLLPKFAELKAKKLNEANTKALVVEPIVRSLGWDLLSLEDVEREYRVFDNTVIDYVLKLEKPVLFLEAKAFGAKLTDKSYIAQAVNYANNEGVVWCVLTNGRQWRVYKSNEPVPMERKLLFEVDLAGIGKEPPPADTIEQLALLSKASLSAAILDRYGDSIFTDSRVRSALSRMNKELPTKYVNLVREYVEGDMDAKTVRASLARIEESAPVRIPKPPKKGGGPGPTKPSQYDLDRHLNGKPENIRLLYQELHEEIMKLGPGIGRGYKKQYISYTLKRSFTTVQPKGSKILIYVSVTPSDVSDWDNDLMRDVRQIGHYGMGDTEFVLTQASQIPQALAVIRKGYDRRKRE